MKTIKMKITLIFLFLLFLIAAPFIGIYPVTLMTILCFALFAASFNLLLGYVGLLSFGHAAFFGGGAYIAGYASKTLGLPPELCVLLSGLAVAFLGVIMGYLAIQRTGIYFSMITLALSQMVYFAAKQAPFTGGKMACNPFPVVISSVF